MQDPKTQTDKYLYSNIMTAGKLKSVMMLLGKARNLTEQINPSDLLSCQNEIRQCKNIIAQLEMSLNLKSGETARHIFEMYELIYTALENPTEKSMKVAKFLLEDFTDALKQKFRQ